MEFNNIWGRNKLKIFFLIKYINNNAMKYPVVTYLISFMLIYKIINLNFKNIKKFFSQVLKLFVDSF
jgi:hypothetical protein